MSSCVGMTAFSGDVSPERRKKDPKDEPADPEYPEPAEKAYETMIREMRSIARRTAMILFSFCTCLLFLRVIQTVRNDVVL